MHVAISIANGILNKAQGQTFSEIGINMQRSCFSHGLLYVALSGA